MRRVRLHNSRIIWLSVFAAVFSATAVPVLSQSDGICRIVQRNRVACQVHRVQTDDGYLLALQRIPPPRRCLRPLRPFVLMHGLLGSAGDFVNSRRAHALGYRLHERCFDVWLANARGTTYSRQHRQLSTRQPAFWQFSFHEIGFYDLASIVDYVLAVTQQQQLHYVGHSQGTTALLVLLSQRPAYNARFASATLLAPVAYLQHLSSPPLRLLASDGGMTTLLLNSLGLDELLPASALTQVAGQFFCSATLPTYALCTFFTSLVAGFSEFPPTDRLHYTRLLETTPAGISRRQLQHFAQLMSSGIFRQFDYGSAQRNMQSYGQSTPPVYRLNNVRIPLLIFLGSRDLLATQPDVLRLVSEVRNSRVTLLQVNGYNHFDFLFSETAASAIYERIIINAWQIDKNVVR